MWLVGLSSAVSFIDEILFTRMIGHLLGGSVFAFASMLAAFLLGIALGGGIASRLASTPRASAIGFMLAQCGTALLALLSWHLLQALAGWVNRAAVNDATESIPRELLAIAILIPPAITIGMTFPWAIRIHARDQRDAASSSAKVYATSTLGGVMGAFLAGTYLLPWLNYQWVLVVAIAANLTIAVLVWWQTREQELSISAKWLAVAALVGLVASVFRPTIPTELLRVSSFENFVRRGNLVYSQTGRSATVTLFNDAGQYVLSTNGLPEAGTTPKGELKDWTTTPRWLGLIPAVLRPQAKSMLIVGFGSGTAPAHTPDSVRKIDIFELEPRVLDANRLVASEREDDPFSDSRIRLILNDGRGGLALTRKKYDLVVSQPSHPWTAGASHLYTLEFAELVRDHLTEDGLFLLWMDQQFVDEEIFRSLAKTITSVFPHTSLFQPNSTALLFVGSLAEISLPSDPPKARSASDSRLFRELGLVIPQPMHAYRSLDDVALRRISTDSTPTTDNNNLLALRQMGREEVEQANKVINKLIDQEDPLLRATSDAVSANLSSIVLRRIGIQRFHNAKKLIDHLSDEAEREILTGYLANLIGDPMDSVEHFRQALSNDPNNPSALSFLYLSEQHTSAREDSHDSATGSPVTVERIAENVPYPLRAIAEASEALHEKAYDSMPRLDNQLAEVPTDHVLFGIASTLRLVWREQNRSSGTQLNRGRQMLSIIETLAPFVAEDDLHMFRLRAASFAGKPDIVLSTAKQVADTARTQLAKSMMSATQDEPALRKVDPQELRIRLTNALTAITPFENHPRVAPHRFYGVRMYVSEQLAAIVAGLETP